MPARDTVRRPVTSTRRSTGRLAHVLMATLTLISILAIGALVLLELAPQVWTPR